MIFIIKNKSQTRCKDSAAAHMVQITSRVFKEDHMFKEILQNQHAFE